MVELKEDDPTVAILRGTKGEAIWVDLEDYERVACYSWRVYPYKQTCYARTTYQGRTFLLHRVIMRCAVGDPRIVDHRDDDGLNNTKRNLRYATHRQNTARQRNHRLSHTGYIGVEERNGRYLARCRKDGKLHLLGKYDTAKEAAQVYDEFVTLHLGEFARLNFPEERQRDDGQA